MRKLRGILLGCMIAAFVSTCTDLDFAGGGLDTETSGGTVLGLLIGHDGTPEKNARVLCIPSSYNALKDAQLSASLINTTDETGYYRFDRVKKGEYNIQAVSLDKKTGALIPGINVGSDPIRVPRDTLHTSGTIKIIFPDAGNDASGYCYLPGTTCFAPVQNGYAVLGDVPARFAPSANYFNVIDSTKSHVVKTGFYISPGDTTVIADLTPWKSTKKLCLNTTVAGANITGKVFDFPVLVRLNSGNFPFREAQSAGVDVRFTKQDGFPLPYEIEQWDEIKQQAEIWVKVDTVFGNDSSHFIIMYWGSSAGPATQSLSNSGAVFDTANGFQGVWHLGEASNAIAKDATGNHYDGTPSDTAPAGASGPIGPCRSFNGSSNGIRMNGTADSKLNFQENGNYTISAWAYADMLDNGYHMVAGKGNEQYFLGLKRSVPDTTMRWEFVEYHDKAGWNITEEYPSAKTWTYLVGVRNGTSQCLYVNGVLIDSSIFVSAYNAPRNAGDDITIGKFITTPAYGFEGKCPFLGKIDEVRISNSASSADWIKLCYMNQKAQDALVVFK